MATYCFVPLSIRQNFVVCPHEPLLKLGVQWLRKGCGNTWKGGWAGLRAGLNTEAGGKILCLCLQ